MSIGLQELIDKSQKYILILHFPIPILEDTNNLNTNGK